MATPTVAALNKLGYHISHDPADQPSFPWVIDDADGRHPFRYQRQADAIRNAVAKAMMDSPSADARYREWWLLTWKPERRAASLYTGVHRSYRSGIGTNDLKPTA